MKAAGIAAELKRHGSPEKAAFVARYFKTGKGEYGEGDIFLGVNVPTQDRIAKSAMPTIGMPEIQKLIQSKIHEHRFTALNILVHLYESKRWMETKAGSVFKNQKALRKAIVDFYLKNLKHVNNWDLVDTSARYILGAYLYEYDRSRLLPKLLKMAKSKNMWERRVAMVSTHHAISEGSSDEAIELAKALLMDSHDLMHKAVGWMLREMGKKSAAGEKMLHAFLREHSHEMPRTMLRYAIERLSPEWRAEYMSAKLRRSSR